MLGVFFFVLRGSVLVLRYYCTLRDLYCSLVQNGVEIAAVEAGAASIDGHAAPKGHEWPCRDPGTSGGALEPRTDVRGSKNRFLMKIY